MSLVYRILHDRPMKLVSLEVAIATKQHNDSEELREEFQVRMHIRMFLISLKIWVVTGESSSSFTRHQNPCPAYIHESALASTHAYTNLIHIRTPARTRVYPNPAGPHAHTRVRAPARNHSHINRHSSQRAIALVVVTLLRLLLLLLLLILLLLFLLLLLILLLLLLLLLLPIASCFKVKEEYCSRSNKKKKSMRNVLLCL